MIASKTGSGAGESTLADNASRFIADRDTDSAFFIRGDASRTLDTAAPTRSSATIQVIEAGRDTRSAVYGRAIFPGFAIQAFFNTLGAGNHGERVVLSVGRLDLNVRSRKVAEMAVQHIVMPYANHLGRRAHKRAAKS